MQTELVEGNVEDKNEAESPTLDGTTISIPLSLLPSNPALPPSTSRAVPAVTSLFETPWSTKVSSIPQEGFSSEVGPTVDIPVTPLEIFELYYTPQCLQQIVDASNRYAMEVMNAEKYESWKLIDVADLKAFFGFNILMGLNQLPSVNDYWKRSEVYHYAPIAERISRDRYRDISRYLHFVNNSTLASRGSTEYDRLGKIRPLADHIQSRCASLYNPSKNLAVDEAMIKFQGRSSLKQYMPQKPVKRGIKVWVLADSTNGYFSRFEIYTGRKENAERGLGARVGEIWPVILKENGTISILKNFSLPRNCFAIWSQLALMDVEQLEEIGKDFQSS